MRGAVAAQHLGVFPAYEETVNLAMWREGLKMDDPEVFVAALDAAGLPGAEIAANCQDPAIKAELVANTERAVARGALGAPTFFVGDEIFFGKDHFEDGIASARPWTWQKRVSGVHPALYTQPEPDISAETGQEGKRSRK